MAVVPDSFPTQAWVGEGKQRIQRALEVLLDDYHRQGRRLTQEQVERTLERRHLDASEAAEVWRRLPPVERPEVRACHDRRVSRVDGQRRGDAAVDLLGRYLRDLGSVPVPTPEEQTALARRVAAGRRAAERLCGEPDPARSAVLRRIVADGEAARDLMLVANLRLVVSIATRYRTLAQRLDVLDLIQEGTLGLVRAVEKFDHTRGFQFSTYATWWIRQGIDRAICDTDRPIRMPVHVVETLRRIRRAQRQLFVELQREPSAVEIGRQIDVDPAKVQFLLEAGQPVASLDAPIGDDALSGLDELLADTTAVDPSEAATRGLFLDALLEALEELPERERKIVRLRYGLEDGNPRTLQELGETFHLTRERIRQLEARSLTKLRRSPGSDRLRAYLDLPTRPQRVDNVDEGVTDDVTPEPDDRDAVGPEG